LGAFGTKRGNGGGKGEQNKRTTQDKKEARGLGKKTKEGQKNPEKAGRVGGKKREEGDIDPTLKGTKGNGWKLRRQRGPEEPKVGTKSSKEKQATGEFGGKGMEEVWPEAGGITRVTNKTAEGGEKQQECTLEGKTKGAGEEAGKQKGGVGTKRQRRWSTQDRGEVTRAG
jgi:hypothetical protein